MCTSARVAAVCWLALSVGAGQSAQADPLQDWAESPDARVVVVLLDGLAADPHAALTLDGDLVMPHTAAWSRGAIVCEDVLVTTTQDGLAREELDRVLQAFSPGQVRWVRGHAEDPSLALDRFARETGRSALVIDLEWLTEPLRPRSETLATLDPAPWISLGATLQIEDQIERRLTVAARLAPFRARGASRANRARRRDLDWVVQAAHRDADARLAGLLERAAALGPETAVLLTATSSMARGARSWQGTHRGAELDVARVPFLFALAGVAPAVDSSPRQWLSLDPAWLRDGRDPERWTWAWPVAVNGAVHPVGQVRWTTAEFTVLDTTLPVRSPRVFDLALDPGEWLDQGIINPALADSLRRELRARLYGPAPTLVLRGGPAEQILRVDAADPIELPDGARPDAVRLPAGGELRIRMPEGATDIRFGRELEWMVGDRMLVLDALIVHSPEWRAAFGAGVPASGPGLWIE